MSPRKKRSHNEQTEEPEGSNEGARKRGRPRVDHPAQSSAERRRTQIRMAQRAYRQRKEGAMDELKARVNVLNATIDRMNSAFEDCRTLLTSGGLLETQAHELGKISRSYKQWIESIRKPGGSEHSERDRVSQEIATSGEVTSLVQTVPVPAARNVPTWIDQRIVQQHAAMQSQGAPPLGYGLIKEDDLRAGASRSSSGMIKVHTPTQSPDYENSGALDGLRLNYPMRIFLRGLDPPRTYSHQEPTLARRIHRAAMELLYEFVLDIDSHREMFDRVFALSFLPRDPNKLAPGLRLILDRGPNEALDGEVGSTIHIGGAGTHYPRCDPVGRYQPRSPGTYVGVVTLDTLKLLESSIEDNISLDVAGFEGQWFDPYDVEGYLNEKGIHLDPGATFVEADLSQLSSSSSSASSQHADATSYGSSRRQLLPSQVPSGSTSVPLPQAQSFTNNPTAWEDLLGKDPLAFGTVGFSDLTGSWMNFLPPSQPSKSRSNAPSLGGTTNLSMFGQYCMDPGFGNVGATALPSPVETQKKSAVIDVAKFVRELVSSGRCLGRTPGFRREDVDRLLTGAVVEAY